MTKRKDAVATRKLINYMRLTVTVHDLISIMRDVKAGDLSYLWALLTQEGTTFAMRMTDKEVAREWIDGEYAAKEDRIKNSGFAKHGFIKQLLKERGKLTPDMAGRVAGLCA